MRLRCQFNLLSGESFSLVVRSQTTLAALKQKITRAANIPIWKQKLVINSSDFFPEGFHWQDDQQSLKELHDAHGASFEGLSSPVDMRITLIKSVSCCVCNKDLIDIERVQVCDRCRMRPYCSRQCQIHLPLTMLRCACEPLTMLRPCLDRRPYVDA